MIPAGRLEWWAPEGGMAHAFVPGEGGFIFRSLCGRLRWTAHLRTAERGPTPCRDCVRRSERVAP